MRRAEDKVLIFVRPLADRWGTHFVSSRLFAAEYLRWGFAPLFIDDSSKSDLALALAALKNGEAKFAHCEQGRALDLTVTVGSGKKGLFEFLGIPAIAHVRDYPFVPWLRPHLEGAGSTSVIFHTDALARDVIALLGMDHGEHHFAPHVFLDHRQPPEESLLTGERDIDVLYAGSYSEPEQFRTAFKQMHPAFSWAVDALIDLGLGEFRRPIHRLLCDEVLPAQNGEVIPRTVLADLLFLANQFIRFERRRRLFVALARLPVDIIWAGPTPEVSGVVKARIRGATPLTEVLDLMCRSRYMVMTLNNFSHSLNERLLSAMARGCVPVTQSNSLIDNTFRNGVEVLLLGDDLSNLSNILGRQRDRDHFAAMSAAARRRVVHEFSPAARVRQFLSHIGLVSHGTAAAET